MQGKKQSKMPVADIIFWLAIIILLYVCSMRINTQGVINLGIHY